MIFTCAFLCAPITSWNYSRALLQAKAKFHSACRDAERALINYEKAQQDPQMQSAKLTKVCVSVSVSASECVRDFVYGRCSPPSLPRCV